MLLNQSLPFSVSGKKRLNAFRFLRFAAVLFLFVFVYMHIYRHLMSIERSEEVGFVESIYWVLTTMSTLGYGDITFSGNNGRLFSMLVMFTGVFYLFYCTPLCVYGVFVQTVHGISNWSTYSKKV